MSIYIGFFIDGDRWWWWYHRVTHVGVHLDFNYFREGFRKPELICWQVGKMQCFGVKNADFCKLNHMFWVDLTESIHPWGVTFWWTDSVTGVSKTFPYNKERLLWMGKSCSTQVSREQAFNGSTSKGTCQGGSSPCATPRRFIAFSKWWNDTEGGLNLKFRFRF